MTDQSNEFPWIESMGEEAAREALHILRDIASEMDSRGSGRPVRIDGYSHDTPPSPPIGSDEYWVQRRTDAANDLVKRGVLKRVRAEYVGGSPYVDQADIGHWLWIEPNEATVRRALAILERRLRPRTVSAEPRAGSVPPTRTTIPSGLPQTSTAKLRETQERGLRSWEWWRDNVIGGGLGGVFTWITIALLGAIWAFTLGPCKRSSEPVATTAPSLPDTATVQGKSLYHETEGNNVAVSPARRRDAVRPATWAPHPYHRLRIREARTHALEFKLYGDSIITDALLEQGAKATEQWPTNESSVPMLSIESYDYYMRLRIKHTYRGEWITFEHDRAIFMLPKDSTLAWNLRVDPLISTKGESREPRVQGKWTSKKRPGVWSFRIQAEKDGSLTRRGWADARPHAF